MNLDTVASCYAIKKRVSNPKMCSFIFQIICGLELIWRILGGSIQPHLSKPVVNDQHVKGAKRLKARWFSADEYTAC